MKRPHATFALLLICGAAPSPLLSTEAPTVADYSYRLSRDGKDPRTFDLKPKGEGTLLPEYRQSINASGISYDLSVRQRDRFENLRFAGAQTLTVPGLNRDFLQLGAGTIRAGGSPPAHYADLYKMQALVRDAEVFTLGFGTGKAFSSSANPNPTVRSGGFFIGVGTAYDPSRSDAEILAKLQPQKIGFILPTGSGLLLVPSRTPDIPYAAAYQGLNQSFNPASRQALKTNRPGAPDYITQSRYTAENNPLKGYFPKEVESAVQSRYGMGEEPLSPASLASLYKRTDPTGSGGIYQLSHLSAEDRRFEYKTYDGFQFSQQPVRRDFIVMDSRGLAAGVKQMEIESTLARRFRQERPGEWRLESSLRQTGQGTLDPIRGFQKRGGGTAEVYLSQKPLTLSAAIGDDWRKEAQPLLRQSRVFARYETAIRDQKRGLNDIQPGVSDISRQIREKIGREGDLLPEFETGTIRRQSRAALPALRQSRKDLNEIGFGMAAARETEFVLEGEHRLYLERKEAAENSFASAKTLPARLDQQNILRNSILVGSDNHEILADNASRFRNVSGRVVQELAAFARGGDLFGVAGLESAAPLLGEAARRFESDHLQPSDVEFAKAKMFLKDPSHPYALGAAALAGARGMALEGREEGKFWKRAAGELLSEKLFRRIPLTTLGERMISAYATGAPRTTGRDLLIGAMQTLEDGPKAARFGGFLKGK